MGKSLIITEKPSVARDFARVLKVSGNQNGYIENNEYVISWCYGHLVQMVYPEEYDIKYKTWNLEDLPFLPKDYKYGVVESAKDQYKVVNGLLHREDIDTVYWAGDSGKEGQTIEENIRNYGGVREGMTELRVWIDSQTEEEIKLIEKYAFGVNDILSELWRKCGVILVDFKLEFGRLSDGTIVLADEISPDTCRLWDSETKEKLDKDRFRRDLGGVEEAYKEIMSRLEANMED